MTDRPLDIFNVIRRIDQKDRSFYDTLTEKEASSITPIVLQRWLTTGSVADLICTNEVVNPYIFSLAKHKKLLWLLLTAVGNKSKPRRSWIPQHVRKPKKPLTSEVISKFLQCSMREAEIYVDSYTQDQIEDAAEQLGWQDDQLKKLSAEFDRGKKKTS